MSTSLMCVGVFQGNKFDQIKLSAMEPIDHGKSDDSEPLEKQRWSAVDKRFSPSANHISFDHIEFLPTILFRFITREVWG